MNEKSTHENAVSQEQVEKVREMLGASDVKGAPFANTKMEILISSVPVFVEKGVMGTTVQDLLGAAKVSRRTFYKYFRSKMDVIDNIYQLSIDILINRFKDSTEQAQTLSELIDECVNIYFDYHKDLGPIIRLMQEEAMRSDSPLAIHRQQVQNSMVEFFDEAIMRIQKVRFDRWVLYSLVWAVESASIHLLMQNHCANEELVRCKDALRGILGAVLITEGHKPIIPCASDTKETACV